MSNIPGWVNKRYLDRWGDRNWKFIYHEFGYSKQSPFVDVSTFMDSRVNEFGEVVGRDKILYDAPEWYLRVEAAISQCDENIIACLWAYFSVPRWPDGREMFNGDKAKLLNMGAGTFKINVRLGRYVVWRYLVVQGY